VAERPGFEMSELFTLVTEVRRLSFVSYVPQARFAALTPCGTYKT